MRRNLLALVLLATPVLLIGPTSSAQEGEGEVAFLDITKVVDGDGPTGGYVIEYSCVGDDEGGGIGTGGSLPFDAAGPDNPETQRVELSGPGTCTVTETDSNGAGTVTYACAFEPAPQGAPGFDGEGKGPLQGSCLDDQSGQIVNPQETLTITVTNTFEADVLPDDEDPPPAVDPGVVTATPPFTG